MAEERPAWRLDVVGASDGYSQRRERESQLDVALGRRLAEGWTPVLAWSHQRRFGVEDDRGELWLYSPGRGPAYSWMAVAATPANDFLADWEAEGGTEVQLGLETSLVARVRYRSYPDERTAAPGLTLRRQLLPWLALDGGYTVGLSDTQPTVGTVAAGVQVDPGGPWNGHLGATHGRENAPPLPVSVVDTVTLTLHWQASPSLGWRGDLTYERREGLYERRGVAVGATMRF
jgi:YaiO family outer membrane protein